MSQWQYLGFVEPLSKERGARLTWYQPMSEPVRRVPMPPLEMSPMSPVMMIAGTRTDWYQPLSEPTRRIPPTPLDMSAMPELPWSPPPPFSLDWWPNVAEPVRFRRPFLYETGAERPPASIAVVLIDIAWYQALSEPMRAKWRQLQNQTFFVFSPSPGMSWYVPLSEPTRRKVFQIEAVPIWSGPTQGWTIPTCIHAVRASFTSPTVSLTGFSTPSAIRATFTDPDADGGNC